MCRATKVILAVISVSVLALGLALAGCSTSNSPSQGVVEGNAVGNLAPDFKLSNLNGQTVQLSQFRGKPVLLNFWATWCGPCREEMPLIQKISQDKGISENGLVILAIDLGENSATVDTFLKSNGFTFPALLDTKQAVASMYDVRAIPTTFFIDNNGIIKNIKIGAFLNESEIIAGLGKIIP